MINLSLSSSQPAMAEMFHEVADDAAHAGAVLVCAMNNVMAPTYPSQFAAWSRAAAAGDELLVAGPRRPSSGRLGSTSRSRGWAEAR